MRRAISTILPLAAAAVLAAASGCGGGGADAAATDPDPGGPVGYLAPRELERAIGNGFRDDLARLAVMDQRGDDATDLDQPLPSGLLDRVRCRPASPRPEGGASGWGWRCDVAWRTSAGRAARLRYRVVLRPNGCLAAGADPRRATRYDPTIRSFAEDPLNAVVSADPACT
jgi:hypothetical protein